MRAVSSRPSICARHVATPALSRAQKRLAESIQKHETTEALTTPAGLQRASVRLVELGTGGTGAGMQDTNLSAIGAEGFGPTLVALAIPPVAFASPNAHRPVQGRRLVLGHSPQCANSLAGIGPSSSAGQLFIHARVAARVAQSIAHSRISLPEQHGRED